VDRGVRGHQNTQNDLARFLAESGLQPLSPGPGDPGFDVGWWSANTFCVAEVKSLTAANETSQLRFGVGQVLDYVHLIRRSGRTVLPVLAVERQPSDPRWTDLCLSHGIILTWPPEFPPLGGGPH